MHYENKLKKIIRTISSNILLGDKMNMYLIFFFFIFLLLACSCSHYSKEVW